jgi:transcriptional regulator with XRE-family HTH domain
MRPTGIPLNGDELRRRRLELRLTQAEVARQLEMHPVHYARIEMGAPTSLKTLRLLERYWEADPTTLELVHPMYRDAFRLSLALPSDTRPPH